MRREGSLVCERCHARYRKGNPRHQSSARCLFEVARLEAQRRGWTLSGQYTTSIRLAGLEIRRLDCPDTTPIARIEVVITARVVSEAFTLIDYGAWRRHAMIRLIIREPERGPALLTIARLGGDFPLEWLPPAERHKPKQITPPKRQEDIPF